LNRHLVHLSERGYVRLGPPTSEGFRAIWVTADGEMFLQPELAEFGQRPMLPQVVERRRRTECSIDCVRLSQRERPS
jgi:hypothetical protein